MISQIGTVKPTNPSDLLLLLTFVLIASVPSWAQNKEDLERQRLELMDAIEQTTRQLEKTRADKANTLNHYVALQKQISQRRRLMTNLEQEITYADRSIARSGEVIEALQKDVGLLREEYAQMLRVALRHKLNQSLALFLFSSRNFNEAFRRWQYIRQYNNYRRKQSRLIQETQRMLTGKMESIERQKMEKEALLIAAQDQQANLNQELNSQDKLLARLKTAERRLAQELVEQREARDRLNTTIEAIIRAEVEESRTRKSQTNVGLPENRRAERRSEADLEPTPNEAEDPFAQLKGQLPWPVRKGRIVQSFGRHPHPRFKEVQITNNGINIETGKGSEVYAVFGGKVAGIQFIPGYKNTVILQHGNYYTVYSNLETAYVKRGDNVKGRQTIGVASSSKPEIHFEVWREKQRLNPELWVTRR